MRKREICRAFTFCQIGTWWWVYEEPQITNLSNQIVTLQSKLRSIAFFFSFLDLDVIIVNCKTDNDRWWLRAAIFDQIQKEVFKKASSHDQRGISFSAAKSNTALFST